MSLKALLYGALALVGLGSHETSTTVNAGLQKRANYKRKNRGAASARTFRRWFHAQNRRINLDRLALNRARRSVIA